MLLLVLYLHSGYLENRLGKYYFPIAVFIASTTLFIEQYLFTPRAAVWQADSFFFIILILVSWQYNLRAVIAYSVLIALADYALNFVFRPPVFFISAISPVPSSTFGPLNTVIFFGRQTGRILSFLVVGFVITSLVNAQRKQRQELAAANQALVQYSNTLEQLTTSRERNRLSRELHDTVAHTLSALTVQIEALQTAWQSMPERAANLVEKMLNATRSGLNETRRTLNNLRAAPLEELGLALAVQALAQDAAARNNLELKLEISEGNLEVSPEVEQVFYRVAQEALENVVRHANARTLELKLLQLDRHLELDIKDDGDGFDKNAIKNGGRIGLTSMRERADLIGAAFSVESRSGKGTHIRMRALS